MKKLVFICLFVLILTNVLNTETTKNLIHPEHFLLNPQLVANDRDYYYQPIIMPTYLGIFTNIAHFGALGMNFFLWGGFRDWENTGEWVFTYQGDLISEATWTLDETVQIYTNTIENGKITETLITIDIGIQMDTDHYYYYYTGDLLTSWMSQITDYMGGWINSQQGEYTYSGDLMTEYLRQVWDSNSQSWQNSQLYTATYSGDLLDELLMQDWIGSWQNDYFTEYYYSGSQLDETINYDWDGSSWVNDLKETYTYTGEYATTILIEEWLGSSWSNFNLITNTYEDEKFEEQLVEEWSGGDWENYALTDYIYSLNNENNHLPSTIISLKNYPNPFNPETVISYQLSENSYVCLQIYNIKGQLIKNLVEDMKPAGEHTITWNGTDYNENQIPSGLYFYKLSANGKTNCKKMLLLK